MARFSATEAAVEGFRLSRQHPTAILVWSVILTIFSLLTNVALIGLGGGAMADLMQASQTPTADPTEVLAQMSRLGPAYTLVLIASLVIYAVLYAAIYRAMLRPTDRALGFVRFGADELRQGLALIVLYILIVIGAVVFFVVAGLVTGFAAAAWGGVGAVIGILAMLAAFIAIIWLVVKLSLVTPLVFDRRRLDLGAAWRLTKGHFWGLLGAYVLAVILMLVVYLLALVVFTALGALLGGGLSGVGAIFNPNVESLSAYFTPLMLLYTVFTGFISALTLAILVGASGSAYRQLSPTTEAEVFT